MAISKAGLKKKEDICYLWAGDLLGQLVARLLGLWNWKFPCLVCMEPMGEAMGLGAMLVAGGYEIWAAASGVQPFCNCGKQFQFSTGIRYDVLLQPPGQ